MITQMSRTQPPPTAPPTIISIGKASVSGTAIERRKTRGVRGRCEEKGGMKREIVSVSKTSRSE